MSPLGAAEQSPRPCRQGSVPLLGQRTTQLSDNVRQVECWFSQLNCQVRCGAASCGTFAHATRATTPEQVRKPRSVTDLY
jgi:hypothetical protein